MELRCLLVGVLGKSGADFILKSQAYTSIASHFGICMIIAIGVTTHHLRKMNRGAWNEVAHFGATGCWIAEGIFYRVFTHWRHHCDRIGRTNKFGRDRSRKRRRGAISSVYHLVLQLPTEMCRNFCAMHISFCLIGAINSPFGHVAKQ